MTGVQGFPSYLAVRDDNNIPAHVTIQGPRGASAFPKQPDRGIPVVSFWSPPQRYPVSLLLHLLSSGLPCIRITALEIFSDGSPAPTTGRTFKALHEECSSKNKAAVMPLDNGYEILLAASWSDSGPNRKMVFDGFLVSAGAPLVVGEAVGNSRLHLVLDLDETLISAQSMSGLRDRMESLTRRRLAGDSSELLSIEQDLLQYDIEMLREFTDSNTVEVNGQEHQARMETAVNESGATIQRPVIRLHDLGVVLTRIDPDRPDTSMIMRVRAGWEGLRSYLCLMDGPAVDPRTAGKLRFDVFVATAAERGYALEAWRLLDPEARLIPQQRVSRRVVCIPGSRQKKLEKVFNLKDARGSISDGPSPMPTAIIIDDRPEVWEPTQRPQVVTPVPFFPLREMAAALEGSQKTITGPLPLAMWASPTELDRCNALIATSRSSMFYRLDQSSNGQGLAAPSADGSLLPTIGSLLQIKPTAASEAQSSVAAGGQGQQQNQQQQQPAVVQGPDLTPRDPRMNGQQQQQQQRQGPGGQGLGLAPRDPRLMPQQPPPASSGPNSIQQQQQLPAPMLMPNHASQGQQGPGAPQFPPQQQQQQFQPPQRPGGMPPGIMRQQQQQGMENGPPGMQQQQQQGMPHGPPGMQQQPQQQPQQQHFPPPLPPQQLQQQIPPVMQQQPGMQQHQPPVRPPGPPPGIQQQQQQPGGFSPPGQPQQGGQPPNGFRQPPQDPRLANGGPGMLGPGNMQQQQQQQPSPQQQMMSPPQQVLSPPQQMLQQPPRPLSMLSLGGAQPPGPPNGPGMPQQQQQQQRPGQVQTSPPGMQQQPGQQQFQQQPGMQQPLPGPPPRPGGLPPNQQPPPRPDGFPPAQQQLMQQQPQQNNGFRQAPPQDPRLANGMGPGMIERGQQPPPLPQQQQQMQHPPPPPQQQQQMQHPPPPPQQQQQQQMQQPPPPPKQQQQQQMQQPPPPPKINNNKRPNGPNMAGGDSLMWQNPAKVPRQDNNAGWGKQRQQQLRMPQVMPKPLQQQQQQQQPQQQTLAAAAAAAAAAASRPPAPPRLSPQKVFHSSREQIDAALKGGAKPPVFHNCVSLLNTAGHRQRKQVNYSEQFLNTSSSSGSMGWHVEVKVGGEMVGRGESKVKKEAKLIAAFDALKNLNLPRPLTWSDKLPMPSA